MNSSDFISFNNPMQKKYEAVRAFFIDKLSPAQIADKFGYSIHTVYKFIEHLPELNIDDIFLPLKTGPKSYRQSTIDIYDSIIDMRNKKFSITDIKSKLLLEGKQVSIDTIQRIFKQEGFSKLERRSKAERTETELNNCVYPEKSDISLFSKMNGTYECSYSGIFFFLPIIKELGLENIFKNSDFYGSSMIPKENYLISYLTLKLLGRERLSHCTDLSFDQGLGIFAGLNALPKATALTEYSYRHSVKYTTDLLKKFGGELWKRKLINGNYINVDFHNVPYWGGEESLENNWIPTRNKSMKSIVTFLAQDMETNYLLFTDALFSKEDSGDEIMIFVEHFKSISGAYPKHLVFDSKVTTYDKLNDLETLGIKFITLRKRGPKMIEKINEYTEWKKIQLNIPKRIYNNIKVHSEEIKVQNYDKKLREITVTGNGRNLPMILITNDFDATDKDIVINYAKRWRIENNIQENVDFFNLNSVNSPVIVNVNFDIAMTMIANSLYKYLVSKIKPLKRCKPKKIFRSLIESKGSITVEDTKIIVRSGLKAFNPYIIDIMKEHNNLVYPWLQNKQVIFEF